jgi:hypothetical protein
MGAWESVRAALGVIQRAVGDTCVTCSSSRDVNPCTGVCSMCEIESDVHERERYG